jgi:hypothetical protein
MTDTQRDELHEALAEGLAALEELRNWYRDNVGLPAAKANHAIPRMSAALSRLSAQPEPAKDARELWARLLYKLNANIETGPKLDIEAAAEIERSFQARLSASGQGEERDLCAKCKWIRHPGMAICDEPNEDNECHFVPAAPAPEKGESSAEYGARLGVAEYERLRTTPAGDPDIPTAIAKSAAIVGEGKA